jgi:fluoride exporter
LLAALEGDNELLILLLIVLGALGTLARYFLQGWVQEHSGFTFPTGTLVVNLSGCFVIGFFGQSALKHLWISAEWRVALMIGFLGAFTTFSTFGWETVHMLEDGEWMRAMLYVGMSVFGGVVGVILGMKIGELL